MYKKLLVVISSLCLVTCSPKPYLESATTTSEYAVELHGKDNYYFTGKQYQKRRVTIDLILYDSYEDIALEASKYDFKIGEDEYLVAFSLDLLKGNRCEIHMLDPAVAYRPEFTGHEMMHCFYGQFHGSNSTKG